MSSKELLESTQPIVMRTLSNSFSEHKTTHAYLISGQKGAPTKEMAYYLAKSFLCENPKPLACEECLNCLRVQDGSYTDFIFIDGSKSSIKKEVIENLQLRFSRTALEPKGLKVYIIHLIENSTGSAVNSLLKFVEEPASDVIGIFTTENRNQVLPTLLSRCQVLHLKGFEKQELMQKFEAAGITAEDASILAASFSSEEEGLAAYQNTAYLTIKDLVVDTLGVLASNLNSLNYFGITEIIPVVKDPKNCELYLDLLGTAMEDVLKLSLGQPLIFKDQETKIREIMNQDLPIAKFVANIMLNEGRLSLHANPGLIIDSVFTYIRAEGAKHYAEH